MKQHTTTHVIGLALLISLLLFSPVGTRRAGASRGLSFSPHCGGWTIVPSPNATDYQNELSAVAAISATDVWAVGDSESLRGPVVTLIEHWDGMRWTVVPSPNPTTSFDALSGVAAVSASDVWAVGWDNTGPLIDHWDGTSWQSVSSPAVEGTFLGISAQSASDIWAVGDQAGDQPLTEHWDGSAWHLVPAPGVPTTRTSSTA
ncbi:MAG: hypothetical protein ACYDER_28210 [Ktedonobacteraceae bacterium]